MKTKILNRKEIKKVINSLKEQYSIKDLELDYIFILGKEDKLYLVGKKFGDLDVSNLRINSVGLYFGKIEHGKIRLSIEGSQLVGPFAKKNVVTLSKKEIGEWIRGNDLTIDTNSDNLVLVRYGNDFYGSGKCSKGKLLNFVPKSRRIKTGVKV